MVKVIGIDLGTSRSAAAVMVDGEIKIIPSWDNKIQKNKPFPSVVSFYEDGGALIGANALEQVSYNPKGTVFNAKRKMGTGEKFEVFGKEYLPQFISALILLKIKIDAEHFLREKITKAVITVPAYFNDNQRQATRDAGAIAGLEVLRILPEPLAASVAYGLNRITEPTRVVVFDMGAGTLDVSIVEIDQGYFEVIGTGGDVKLGGIDMDEKVTDFLLEEIKKQNPLITKINETLITQLNQLAEKIKIRLSDELEVDVKETFYDGESQISIEKKVTRENFEKMIEPIIKRSEECIFDLLDDVKITPDKIEKVILVGGPTKINAVRKMVASVIKDPETGIDQDFSVAIGAAIEGAVFSKENLPTLYQGLTLVNVTPLALGEIAVMKNRELGIQLMIPKNTTYPTEFKKTFYKEFPLSSKIEISVWQGENLELHDFSRCANLGSFWLFVPQTENLEIEVTYTIDADGILTVSAVETSTGNRNELKIERIGGSSLSPPQLGVVEQEVSKIGEQYKKNSQDVLSPYEIPIQSTQGDNRYSWMCNCLEDAKSIINAFHKGYDCKHFLSQSKFPLFVQLDKQYAFGYIITGNHPYYPIGIHNSLKEETTENRRMVTVVLIHELLHAIHPDWGHDLIRPEEFKLANQASLFDALRNMEILFLSGKMTFCNNQRGQSSNTVQVNCDE